MTFTVRNAALALDIFVEIYNFGHLLNKLCFSECCVTPWTTQILFESVWSNCGTGCQLGSVL